MVRILFIHPDLGIGGAERLVVDAALALKNSGNSVSFLTNHHDRDHCFEETRDGTLRVQTVGDWLPRSIFGRCYAFCAYLRMVYAAFYTTLYISRQEQIDIIFCDQISLGIPILKLAKNNPKIIFYCHFPDQLLSKKSSWIKSVYRMPLDYLEELTTGQADKVLVNSKFTLRIFRETFKRLDLTPNVLYPSLNTKFFDETQVADDELSLLLPKEPFVFLSINRYERKKQLSIAIEAFSKLETLLNRSEWERCHLILAGGYDFRVVENIEYYQELELLACKLKILNKVTLLRSPSDRQKIFLLRKCDCLVYTPENEHFGIVPLEGMYMEKPVIASNSGGPTETIIHDSTGFLCENEEDFTKAMLKLVKDSSLAERMGKKGRKLVQQRFSFEGFADKLEFIISETLKSDKKRN
uniref:Alpha-1,3/1,6-mannosyltransferase ALG2 n=1 Tax=Tabanus bromius TaxID=304241 RepID=A0A0K8TU77_TABBR